MNKLNKSFLFKGFKAELIQHLGPEEAERIWSAAASKYDELAAAHPDLDKDSVMMILPAASLYLADAATLPLLRTYAARLGQCIGRVVHGVTSIPGVPKLLWANMPRLMRRMSGPEKGYQRRIVSESKTLVGVDILACPLHQAACSLGVPEVASVVCTMDKAYMDGFRHIEYTRTTAIGEGDAVCDYRLRYDPNKN